ncbi:hypothetical protein RF11_12634 [Thelohanellus kitauei]|uniref:Sortilin N-terminal domain-containing protein n=1 Tax=Thelohanellus kitauei TaxID=669202 RepID=A0A0C2JAL4_THEKT|nr:hypothetical protein RF11_12634 [Thelohanellus kitauei]
MASQYFSLHGNFYIVANDVYGTNCLFTSYGRSKYFIRIKCGITFTISGEFCSVLIHPHLKGIIYANIDTHSRQRYTSISVNDGKTFSAMTLESNQSECANENCFVKIHLPCNTKSNNYIPKEWILTFKGSYVMNDIIHSSGLVSFNGGKSWKIVPFDDESALILNNGGIVFGVNKITNEIIYSFDEGQVYYHTSVYVEGEQILELLQNGHMQKEYAVIVSVPENEQFWTFTHINFSNILSKTFLFK